MMGVNISTLFDVKPMYFNKMDAFKVCQTGDIEISVLLLLQILSLYLIKADSH